MGLGGIGIWQLLVVLVLVIVIFGSKRLRHLGGDLGGAIKGFKKAMKDDDSSHQALPGDSDSNLCQPHEEPNKPSESGSEKNHSTSTIDQ